MKYRVKIIDRETGEVVEEKIFQNEKQRDAFHFWFAVNGNWESFYIREEVIE